LKAFLSTRIFIFFISCLVICQNGFAQKSKPLSEQQQIEFDKSFINANKEKLINNGDEAVKLFKTCLTLQPDNAAVNFMLSQLYTDKQLYEDAELYAKRAVSFDDNNTWYKKQLADVYRLRKKYKEAAPVYLKIAEADKDPSLEIEAAYMFVLAQDLKKAVKTLDNLEKHIGINEEIINQKEQIYLSQNKLKKAIKEIEKLINAFPNDPKFVGKLADVYMANNKVEKALELYGKVLKMDSTNGLAHFALADYYRSTNNSEKYYSSVKEGVRSKNVDVKSKLSAIVSFLSAKDFENHHDRSFELANIFIGANAGEPTAYMVLGDLYNQNRDFESARNEYLKSIAIEPASFMVWQQIVFCSSELRNNNYLKKDCETALSFFPNEAAFYVYHSIACIQLKQYDSAYNSAKKGIEIVTEPKELLEQLYSTLGDAAHYLKRYDACDSAFEAVLKIDANNAYALNNYAYFLSLRKVNLDKADEMSKHSLDIEPANSSYMDTYGWILYQKKDYINAKDYIEKSLKLTPNSAEVLEHLGDINYKLDHKDEAIKNWKRAKELGSSGEFLDKKIADEKLYE